MKFHYVPTNGIRLHVAQDGPVDGPLVVMLHGFPEFWYGWRKQITALADAGYRVWAPDQRGYNLSDKPANVADYALDTLAQDVVGLLDAAGREKAVIVGHDWGAVVAWWVAATFPQRVERLVILNVPHPAVMRHFLTHDRGQMLRSWYAVFFQLPGLPELVSRAANFALLEKTLRSSSRRGTFSDADIAEYKRAWAQPGALRSMLHWYRAGACHLPKQAALRITVPTRILWGERDTFLKKEMAEASLAYCDTATLTRFPRATHWLQHEEPDAVSIAVMNA